jgi:L-threonylcarbamoyladenylate synthase
MTSKINLGSSAAADMKDAVKHAAKVIREGGVVAFPTETVYGLGANALDAVAVRRIFEIKGRPETSPLIVHVASIEMARDLALAWPSTAEKLAAKFWPGPLTIVVKKLPEIPDIVTAGLATVGLRMPQHPIALELIRAAGVPIAAPSANLFTKLSPVRAEHVRKAFGETVMVLEGGPSNVGIESTVISLAGKHPTLLRPGVISKSRLEAELGEIRTPAAPKSAHSSPGQHRQHYQPHTRVIVGAPPDGQGAYLYHSTRAEGPVNIAMPDTPREYAAALYATLHDADLAGYDWIAVEPIPEDPEWDGVRDRLRRAAAR